MTSRFNLSLFTAVCLAAYFSFIADQLEVHGAFALNSSSDSFISAATDAFASLNASEENNDIATKLSSTTTPGNLTPTTMTPGTSTPTMPPSSSPTTPPGSSPTTTPGNWTPPGTLMPTSPGTPTTSPGTTTTLPGTSMTIPGTSTLMTTSPGPSTPMTTSPGTSMPTTPPVTMTPSTPPHPPILSFVVIRGNETLLRAKLGARIRIHDDDGKDFVVDLPNRTIATGSTNWLLLTFDSHKLIFVFVNDSVEVSYETWRLYGITFTDRNKTATWSVPPGPGTISAREGHSFACDAELKFRLMGNGLNATLETFDLRIQPFMETENESGFGIIERCQHDQTPNTVVPLAVGAALAALIVLVLVLYLIGRRKLHRGYQTV